jgi:hypothetical protein
MPSFLDVTELENLILEIVESQSVTPKQVFQISKHYMYAKEMHAQGNIPLAREIMSMISGVSAEIQGLVEYHFKASGYAEALFAGNPISAISPAKTDTEPDRRGAKPETASRQQNEETDKGNGDKEVIPVDLGKKGIASFNDF